MIGDYALDAALERVAKDVQRLDICTSEPKTIAEARERSLGHTTSLKAGSPGPCPKGRKITVTPGEGTVTRQGKPAVWVLTGASHVLATGALKNTQAVVSGMIFRLPPVEVELER